MAVAQLSASLSLSIHDVYAINSARAHSISQLSTSRFGPTRTSFATGSPLKFNKVRADNCFGFPVTSRTSAPRKSANKATSVTIRCERSTQGGNSLDVWLGRFAMVGFAVAISVEIATGKGLLENFGLTSPLPTVALALTGLIGVLTAVFIFQSASKN